MLSHDTASHLQEARDYMRSINNHGLDVSALYIAQAYLTKLQTSLRPTCTLHALFTQEDLLSMVELCRKGVIVVPSFEGYNQRIIFEPLLKYFKIGSVVEATPCENTVTEVSHLMTRILDALEEWEIINGKARKISAKLEQIRREKREFLEVRKMEESLDAFLDKIMQAQHNKTEFTTVQSLNQTCSIAASQPSISEEDEKAINQSEIGLFLGYISMWMNQTLQEICELKAILDLAKSQSSLDQNCPNVSHLRKQKFSKNSLLTSKIKQGHIDIPKIEANFFDENHLPKGVATKSVINYPKSQMSFMSQMKPERSSQQQRVPLGNLNINREMKTKRSSENCTKCEIY